MAEARITRRLAAILAADVVGYSRMMAGDEPATLAALKRHREAVFDPMVAQYSGRIVKLIGDGIDKSLVIELLDPVEIPEGEGIQISGTVFGHGYLMGVENRSEGWIGPYLKSSHHAVELPSHLSDVVDLHQPHGFPTNDLQGQIPLILHQAQGMNDRLDIVLEQLGILGREPGKAGLSEVAHDLDVGPLQNFQSLR